MREAKNKNDWFEWFSIGVFIPFLIYGMFVGIPYLQRAIDNNLAIPSTGYVYTSQHIGPWCMYADFTPACGATLWECGGGYNNTYYCVQDVYKSTISSGGR
jgi:hypothetical protein